MADIIIAENDFSRKVLAPYDTHPVIRYEVKTGEGVVCTDAVPFEWEELRRLSELVARHDGGAI